MAWIRSWTTYSVQQMCVKKQKYVGTYLQDYHLHNFNNNSRIEMRLIGSNNKVHP